MRKNDLPLLDKAINEVVMESIEEMEFPRGMIGGHEHVIDLPRYFAKDHDQPVFVDNVKRYLRERRMFPTYDEATKRMKVTINFAVCRLTDTQEYAFKQKLYADA